ncbi:MULTISPECIES: PAS domain S-box protein [unclassified Polaribacter]|uniref:PAS domain S-box protein n=1 Tax=unclassified Polaribacter TaxID=196858 RepID=UPI0011BD6976|nr:MULTISPECIES: PAS domain S-box protein [unclassified Polaribacter]TXD51994.1 PAS domain S-box protein [Polaribacter sp. IC063]TXD58663.1 PAS domain S-box protein [Polaribacter sp. IC066]
MSKELQDIDLLNSIFQSSIEGILVIDANDTILKCNLASEKLFGYETRELINQKIENLIPNKFRKPHQDPKEEYKANTKTSNIEEDLESWGLKKDGSQFPLKINLNPTIIKGRQVVIAFLVDITVQKTKEALFSIKNNALASTSNGIVIADAQNIGNPLIYCNEAFTKITGYTQKEALDKNCSFLQNNDRNQKGIGVMKNAIANGKGCNAIVRNYKKDGTLFWNDITITPLFNEANTLTHFIGVQSEVTNKIKQEDLKNQTRKILEFIAQDKPIRTISKKIIKIVETQFKDCLASILVLDKEHRTPHKLIAPNLPKEFITDSENSSFNKKKATYDTPNFLREESIVSNIKENILWKNHKEVVLTNDLKAYWSFPIMSSTKQTLGTFSVYNKHAREPSKEEKEIALDMSYLASIAIERHHNVIKLLENKKNLEKHAQKLKEKVASRTSELTTTVQKLVESNLSFEDQIEETLAAQKSAIASKSLLSAIAKNFPNGFILVFNADFKMLLVEGEAIIKLGLDKMIFKETTADDIDMFSEKQKIKLKQDILKTIAGEHLGFEIKYKNLYFSVNTIPLADSNTVISSALFVYSNITTQKKIEQDSQNALEKEQELNGLKSQFISMASHEFRTPLSAIQTSAILIGKQNGVEQEPKREKYVAQIKKNVKQLVVILNDFLSLSKLEEGRVIAHMQLFDFVALSKTLIEEVSITKKIGKNILFSSPSEPVFLNLDPKLVRHILMNLVSNAIKYSPKNTDINIKIAESDLFVSLEVKDQGIGIPEQEQGKLFERFFRAKNAQNIEGTGLGLHIVKQYVDLMAGTIDFKSTPDKGTTFLIKWPKQPK